MFSVCPVLPCAASAETDFLYLIISPGGSFLIVTDGAGYVRAAAPQVAAWTLRYHLDHVTASAARRGAAVTPAPCAAAA